MVRRSRKGAWIEIPVRFLGHRKARRRSRKGAWIEITYKEPLDIWHLVAPVRERGLKYLSLVVLFLTLLVAPVRERGLKSNANGKYELSNFVAPVRERGLK